MARLPILSISLTLGIHLLFHVPAQAFNNIVLTTSSSYQLRSRNQNLIAWSSTEERTTSQEESIPYIESRGDGSTGGGGLPMPNQREKSVELEDDELRRPKVRFCFCSSLRLGNIIM